MPQQNHLPDYLSHYYERVHGPFLSLTHLPVAQAETQLENIRRAGVVFASKRAEDYLSIRRELEERVRELFIIKGGKPKIESPHYMILGSCPWLLAWYQDGCEIRVPLENFDSRMVSFTYGDTFPAMRYPDGKPYRGQVYTLNELPDLIREFGLPQDWNPDGTLGPDRYIEAQVWENAPVQSYLPGISTNQVNYP